MTGRQVVLSIAMVAAAAVLAVGLATRARVQAQEAQRIAAGQRAVVAQQATDVLAAREADGGQQVPVGRPDGDLAAGVQSAMRAVGVADACLRSLTPVGDEAIDQSDSMREMRYRLDFTDIDVPRLGRWLAEWRRTDIAWQVTDFQLDLVGAPAGRGGLGPPRATARIVIAARYLAPSSAIPASTP